MSFICRLKFLIIYIIDLHIFNQYLINYYSSFNNHSNNTNLFNSIKTSFCVIFWNKKDNSNRIPYDKLSFTLSEIFLYLTLYYVWLMIKIY